MGFNKHSDRLCLSPISVGFSSTAGGPPGGRTQTRRVCIKCALPAFSAHFLPSPLRFKGLQWAAFGVWGSAPCQPFRRQCPTQEARCHRHPTHTNGPRRGAFFSPWQSRRCAPDKQVFSGALCCVGAVFGWWCGSVWQACWGEPARHCGPAAPIGAMSLYGYNANTLHHFIAEVQCGPGASGVGSQTALLRRASEMAKPEKSWQTIRASGVSSNTT